MTSRRLATAIIAIISLIGTFSSSAQFRWGPSLGLGLTDLHFRQELVTVHRDAGFSAGVLGEMMFAGIGFGIDTGAFYEMRGATLDLGEKQIWESQGYKSPRMFLHELVIPFHLRFKYTNLKGLEDYVAPFVSVGPSMGFLMGHSKLEAFSFAGADLNLDFNLGFEVLKHWQISGGYNLGMTYITKAKVLTNYSARSRVWNLRVAYLF